MVAKVPAVPEFFCTNVRKVEPIGSGCIRVYCAIERNGAWEDQFTVVVPIAAAVTGAKFVSESATDISNEVTAGTDAGTDKERSH
jgi:hypothetical protein